MKIVGCDNPELVFRSFHTLIGALDKHLCKGSFFMVDQTPTVADFALYGQLSQLVIDRTPDEYVHF